MFQALADSLSRRTGRILASHALLASVLLTGAAAHAQGLFQPPASTQAAGTTPKGVAAADLALSGYQSLIVTNSASNNMKVYLGTGADTFATPTTYHTCTGPTAVLTVDENLDGYPDVLVACPAANTVDLFLNNGSSAPGTFGIQPYAISVTDPVAIVTGNFQGSDLVDAAAASGTGNVTVILNQNGSPVTSTISVPGTLTGIASGDFNHDGNTDLAVSDSANNNVHILFGDGTGNFTASASYTAGTKPSAIAAVDFNHDGNLDLAVTNAGSNTVTVLLGSSAGTFTAVANPQAAGTDPIALSVLDVNNDGNPDVVAYDGQNSSSTSQGAYSVLLGNGDGSLQTPQTVNLTAVPGTTAAVADFNRDGKPDLAITLQGSNTVTLLVNNTLPTPYPGGRNFSAGIAEPAGNGNMADGIATGDFNKDGLLDVAVTYLEDNVVRVLQNNGNGFTLTGTYAVGKQPYSISSADLNGDGYPDLVAVNTTDGTISVLLNNKNGTFATASTYTVGRLPYQVAIGDVNGDGYPDLAVTNYGANTVSVLYGSKAGAFTAGPTLATGTNPYGVIIADFQHDGHPDIAVTCFHTDMLYVYPNNGSGAFGSPYTYSTGSGPMSLVSGDFNRDGNLDIVVANATGGPAGDTNQTTSGNNVSFFAGKGDGTFLSSVYSPSLNFPDSIAAGDVNGDGILDIVGVAPNFNAVEVTLGKGDGTFGTTQQRAAGEFTAKKQPWALALGDFNNDGQLDIVTANTYNQVNITIPAYQQRYMTQYPPVQGGVPSVDLLLNESAATIALTSSPASPLPAINTGVSITASVQPALAGGVPTGSVIFEDGTGAALGTGPYTLNSSGTASYSTGALGSGQYSYTVLYSGDTAFQPATASGGNFTVTVSGTPVTLTLSPTSVAYGSTFKATVSVTGNAASGTPTGTVTIYSSTGGFSLAPITLVNGGGTATYTANSPNLVPGTYQLYAYYTPATGSPYTAGTSSYATLTVTDAPTSLAISCSGGFFGDTCTATVTVTTTNTPVPAGNKVNFTVNGGTATAETTNSSGQATYSFAAIFGSFTVAATFPQQSYYLTSSNSTAVLCFFYCGAERGTTVSLNAFEYGSGSSTATSFQAGGSSPLPLY